MGMCSTSAEINQAPPNYQEQERALGLHYIRSKDYIQLLAELSNNRIQRKHLISRICNLRGGSNLSDQNLKYLSNLLNHPFLSNEEFLDPVLLLSLGVLLTKGKDNDKVEQVVGLLRANQGGNIDRSNFKKFLEAEVKLASICIPIIYKLDQIQSFAQVELEQIKNWCDTISISIFNNQQELPCDLVLTKLSGEFKFCFNCDDLRKAYKRKMSVEVRSEPQLI